MRAVIAYPWWVGVILLPFYVGAWIIVGTVLVLWWLVLIVTGQYKR